MYCFPVDKETIKYLLVQAVERPLPAVVPRAVVLPPNARKVVALVGIRRCGKTYLLFETMQRLLAQGIDRRQLLYLNFEDDRLFPIHPSELDLILRAHDEVFPDLQGQARYLFFDEVQNVSGWEKFVRRVHDTENAHVFVTGSSSHLLTRELATALRGRSVSYEVFPLSFPEFLAFRGLSHEPYSSRSESLMAAALEEYLGTGGLPELVLAEESLQPRILKDYVDLVFYKDLVERYRLTNGQLMKLLLKHALGQPATLCSVHKLYNDFRSQGVSLSKDTLYSYLAHLEESYVVFQLEVADRSLRKRAMNPKKLHPVDWALGYPFTPTQRRDIRRKLETAVYLHHRRQREDLAYLGGESEVDLVLNADNPEALVNVAFSLTESAAWDREVGAFEAGARAFPKAERVLVAHELTARRPPKGVRVVDAWRYLLGEAAQR